MYTMTNKGRSIVWMNELLRTNCVNTDFTFSDLSWLTHTHTLDLLLVCDLCFRREQWGSDTRPTVEEKPEPKELCGGGGPLPRWQRRSALSPPAQGESRALTRFCSSVPCSTDDFTATTDETGPSLMLLSTAAPTGCLHFISSIRQCI